MPASLTLNLQNDGPMFVGHCTVSLALKNVEKKASLGMLFLAVQFVDILFFPLVLLGIERVNIVQNFTQSTHFELEYMPYTHSLMESVPDRANHRSNRRYPESLATEL
jgi:hypothetical protein